MQESEIIQLDRLTRKEWSEKISNRFKDSVKAIIDIGKYLIQAKEQLAHGEFLEMVRSDLPFRERTAQRLMVIARNRLLSDETYVPLLPPSWGTLYELSRVADEDLEDAFRKNLISPELGRRDIPALFSPKQGTRKAKKKPVESDLESLLEKGKKFGAIYVNPPWKYNNQATRVAYGRSNNSMSLEKIAALPLKNLAADKSHIHIWTPNAFLFDCKHLLDAWGFTYKSVLVWVKPRMGAGNYWRVSHEFLLLGTRGNCPFMDKSQRSWFEAGRVVRNEKPEEVRNKIERVSPPPYLELFGHRSVKGWTVVSAEQFFTP